MHSAQGRISAIEETGDRRVAIVEVNVDGGCPRCAEGRGCGAGIFAADRARCVAVAIDASREIAVGAPVRVVISPGSLLRAAAIVYGLPLAGALVGGVLAQAGAAGDLPALASVSAGLATGLLAARRASARQGAPAQIVPLRRA